MTIDPRIRRIGAACFDGALLTDWEIKNFRADPPAVRIRTRLIPALVRMLDCYQPGVLLIPDIGPRGVRRSANVRAVIEAIEREALDRGIEVFAISDNQVKAAFSRVGPGAGKNKQRVNEVIVQWFPELKRWLTGKRKLWEPERYAQPLFCAVAMWCAWRGVPKKPQT